MNFLKKYLFYILVGLTIASSGTAAYFFKEFRNIRDNPNKLSQQEVKNLVAAVGKLIVLPEDETPTVATVSDPDKLKDQPFFAKSKKGDKVLIFTNAKRAILYDPENHKIVDVAPLNIGNPPKSKE